MYWPNIGPPILWPNIQPISSQYIQYWPKSDRDLFGPNFGGGGDSEKLQGQDAEIRPDSHHDHSHSTLLFLTAIS
jgi:hypothetical protein